MSREKTAWKEAPGMSRKATVELPLSRVRGNVWQLKSHRLQGFKRPLLSLAMK